MRYRGPGLRAAGPGAAATPTRPTCASASRAAHEERYGYRDPDGEVELVHIRLAMVVARTASAARERPPASRRRESGRAGPLRRRVARDPGAARRAAGRHSSAEGPVVFELPEATFVLPPGWCAEVDGAGTIVAERAGR